MKLSSACVIVAPRVRGQQGSASIPTVSSNSDRPTLVFNPWSKLCPAENHVISCYSDDGRIVVNSELNAASNIYAAGSVAKYPNHNTGHAAVAGEGVLDGVLAGKIAAANMARDYYERERVKGGHNLSRTNIFSKNKSLSVMRTDQLSTTMGSNGSNSALTYFGIHALCVGQCDSETMSTHGFWWTNQSRRLSRRRSNAGATSTQKTVYGSGVVYYLDRAGTIRGVMLWGLPFTKSAKNDELNDGLVERMKKIIHTNGDIIQKDHHEAIEKMFLDTSLLCPSHLAEESRVLASMAVSSSCDESLRKTVSRPLHRFLPSKPISTTKMGVLKKNEKIGHGGVGEDIFERAGHDLGSFEGERSRRPSLVHYFQYAWNTNQPIPLDGDDEDSFDLDEDSAYEPLRKHPDHAARPPKEEPLWMRKDEATKTESLNDKLTAMFVQNLKRGHFSDGSDSVQQAPVPKTISNARDEFDKWVENRGVGSAGDDSKEQ